MRGTVGASGSPAGAARSPSRVRRHAAAAAKVLFWGALAALCLAGLSISRLQCGGDMRGCFRHSKPLSGALLESALPPHVHTSGAFALAGQESLSTTQQQCASAVDAIPRIALMFLTRGELWHEGMWREWFRDAAGLVPADVIRASNCSSEMFSSMAAWCSTKEPISDTIGAQHLYSVYVHTQPGFAGFPPTSLFHGTELPVHVKATWGGFDLVDATKALLRAALLEESNKKLMLLSESCVPLYPPALIYQQLMSEPKSRINACPHRHMMPWRWHPKMARGEQVRITPRLWRKTSQWFAIERGLARIIADDTAVADLFRETCVEVEYDEELDRSYECYSDEHYMPVLLAYMGKQDETDCRGSIMNVDWEEGGPHPITYLPDNVTEATFRQLRKPDDCDSAAALRLTQEMFVRAGAPASAALCSEESPWSNRLLAPSCPLFARKFSNHTGDAVLRLLTDCRNKLGIVACWKSGQQRMMPLL
ncbi:g8711 [Coccomyxa elongata]